MKNFHLPYCFKISDLDSIGKDPDCCPFWTKFTKAMSQKLWLPTKTDSVVLDPSYWNGSLRNMMLNSWFSTQIVTPQTLPRNYQKTFWQSLLCLLREIMELGLENSDVSECVKSRKLKLKPTLPQKQILREWFGVSRWVYNQCVTCYNNGTIRKPGKMTLISIKEHRAKIINNCNFKDKNQWMLQYAYDLRDEALRTFRKNVQSNLAKGGYFKMCYKSRKDNKESISVLKKKWNMSRGFYSNIFSSTKMRSTETLPEKLSCDTKLLRNNIGDYYLIKIDKHIISKQIEEHKNAIFIDPGVKNMITGYVVGNEKPEVITVGKRDIERISRLLHHQHKLQRRVKKSKKHKERYSLRKALTRHRNKIYNVIDDMHKKIAKWLATEYDMIFLPKLNFHNFKNTNKQTKEKLATLRHCSLFDRIQEKTREKQSSLYEVNEAYTSKTCCQCGDIDKHLSNKNVYKCSNCDLNIDRDYNGAVNILLRYVSNIVGKVSVI